MGLSVGRTVAAFLRPVPRMPTYSRVDTAMTGHTSLDLGGRPTSGEVLNRTHGDSRDEFRESSYLPAPTHARIPPRTADSKRPMERPVATQ